MQQKVICSGIGERKGIGVSDKMMEEMVIGHGAVMQFKLLFCEGNAHDVRVFSYRCRFIWTIWKIDAKWMYVEGNG